MGQPAGAPIHMVMPHTGQIVYTAIWGAIVAGFAVGAVVGLVRRRDPLLAVLLVGGAIAYFNEPIDDLLGLVWHPRPGQWVLLRTLGPVPVWGVFVYMALFGGIAYLISQALERGVTRRALWTWIGVFWVADIAVEVPAIASGMYRYYGHPPLQVAGLPLYWFAINIGGPLWTAILVRYARRHLTGWRVLALIPIPMLLDAAFSVAMGWPIFSAMHSQPSMAVKYLAAALTIAMGLGMIEFASRLVCVAPAAARRPVATPPPEPAVASGSVVPRAS